VLTTCDCVVTKYADCVAKFVWSRCLCRCRSTRDSLHTLYGVGVGVAPPAGQAPPLLLSFFHTHSLTRFPHTHTHTFAFYTHTHTHTHTNNHKLVHCRISIGRRSTNAYAFPAEGLEELDEMTRAFLGIVEYEVSPHL
jgi:predicted ATPase